MLDTQGDKTGDVSAATQEDDSALEALITFAGALLDLDKLRLVAVLANGPANRMDMAQATGLSHRDLLRLLDGLQSFGLVKLQEPAPRDPDAYSRYELNQTAFVAARKAMGKYKGVRKRPSDSRELIIDTFMPDGRLRAMPLKQNQIIVILDEVAQKLEPDKHYNERSINDILEEVSSDFATLRRYLVDYGYITRTRDSSDYQKVV